MAAHTALAWTASPSTEDKVVVRSAQRGPIPEQNVRIVSLFPAPGRSKMDNSHRRSSHTTGSDSPTSARSSSAADCRYRASESNRNRPEGATSVLRTIRRASYTRPLGGPPTNGGGNESIKAFSLMLSGSGRRGSHRTRRRSVAFAAPGSPAMRYERRHEASGARAPDLARGQALVV